MKTKILVLFIVSCCLTFLQAQDAKEILMKAREKCAGITSGYYEYTEYLKLPGQKDTFQASYECYFKNLPGDTVLSSAFHCRYLLNQQPVEKIMYTGGQLIEFLQGSDIGIVFNKSCCAGEIHVRQREFKFYAPFSGSDYNPLPKEAELSDPGADLAWYGEEIIAGVLCFHIKLSNYPQSNANDALKTTSIDYHFWLREDNFLPIQYSISYQGMMNNETMTQYEKYVLTKYDFITPVDEKQFTRQSIPVSYAMKDYVQLKKATPLSKDTLAPGWTLKTLKDKPVSLADLYGKVVLVEFFYKDCDSSIAVLHYLQSVYKKYSRKKLAVVGIDIYGKADAFLSSFLYEYGITYPVLMGDFDLAKQYRINSCPILYVIGKEGRVITSYDGYKKEMEDNIEKVIKENQ